MANLSCEGKNRRERLQKSITQKFMSDKKYTNTLKTKTGVFYIGDPAYLLSGPYYQLFLNRGSFDGYFIPNNFEDEIMTDELKNTPLVIFSSEDDGSFPSIFNGRQGVKFGVDSAMFSIVPGEYGKPKDLDELLQSGLIQVIQTDEITCTLAYGERQNDEFRSYGIISCHITSPGNDLLIEFDREF